MPAVLEIVTENDIRNYARKRLPEDRQSAVRNTIRNDPEAMELFLKEVGDANAGKEDNVPDKPSSENKKFEPKVEELGRLDRPHTARRVLLGILLTMATAAVFVLVYF